MSVIDLTSINFPIQATLNVTSGALVNDTGGRIEANVGAGGARTLNAQLDNQSTLAVNQTLTLSKTSASHTNSGTIDVTGGN